MKATGIVRRIDDLGRVVIPKEIRRTMRIKEGDPSHITLTPIDKFYYAIHSVVNRYKETAERFRSAVSFKITEEHLCWFRNKYRLYC